MSQTSSAAARNFAPIASMILPLFIACTVLVLVIWGAGFGDGVIATPKFERNVPNRELRAALGALARGIDATWLTLGAVVAYMALVRTEGLNVARRWGLLIVGGALAIGVASALTGLPLGPVRFSTHLGWKLGPVPLGWPFLWLAVVTGAREAVLRLLPRASHAVTAAVAGGLCGAMDWLMEPVAWKYRAWWLWYPAQIDAPGTVPLSAYATWLVVGGAMAFAMRSPHVVPRTRVRPVGPLVVLASVFVACLLGRLNT